MLGSHFSGRKIITGTALFALILLFNSAAYPNEKPVGFAIPSRILPLGGAVTPREYAQLRQAIKADWEREKEKALQEGPGLGSDFNHITATRIELGALGGGFVVYFGHSPECGATGNCPMAVYVREQSDYHRV